MTTLGSYTANIALGTIVATVLILVSLVKERELPNLADVAVVFFAGAAIPAGLRVCYLALKSSVLLAAENERAYIFFGGVAVILVSTDTIWKNFKALLGSNQSVAA